MPTASPSFDPAFFGRLQLHLTTRIDRLNRLGDATGEVQARLRLATIARQIDRPSVALAQLQASLRIHIDAQQWLACADVLMTCAELLLQLGHHEDAQTSVDEARRLYFGQKDVTGLALSEIIQSDLHFHHGKDEDGHACLLRAMNGLTALQLAGPLSHVWIQLAVYHHGRDEFTAEDAALSAAVDCLHVGGQPLHAALCQIQRAVRLGQRGGQDVALAMLEEVPALLGSEREGRDRIEVRIALERARMTRPGNHGDPAIKALRKACVKLEGIGDAALSVAVFETLGTMLATCAQNRGELGDAELILGRAIDLHIERRDPDRVLETARPLVLAGQRLGDLTLAKRWALRSSEAARHLAEADESSET